MRQKGGVVLELFYSFRYFEPVEFFENRSDVVVFWGFSNSMGKSILNCLEAVYWGDVYVQEERIAVVVNYRCSDGRCSFEIEHRVNSAKVADMHEARARKLSDMIGETKVLVKNYS